MISIIETLKEIDLINIFTLKKLNSSHKHIFEIFSYLLHYSVFDWNRFKDSLNLFELKYKMQSADFTKYEPDRMNIILNKISNNKIISKELFDNSYDAINIFFKWIKATVKVYLYQYQNDFFKTNTKVNKKLQIPKNTKIKITSSKIINNNLLFKTSNGFSNIHSNGFSNQNNVTKYPYENNTKIKKLANSTDTKDFQNNIIATVTNTRSDTIPNANNTNTTNLTKNAINDEISKMNYTNNNNTTNNSNYSKEKPIKNNNVYITEYINVDTSFNDNINELQKTNTKTNKSNSNLLPKLKQTVHETSLKLGKIQERVRVKRNDDNFINLMNAGNFLQLKKAFDIEKASYYKEKYNRALVTQNYIEEIEKKGKKKVKLKNLDDLTEVIVNGAMTKLDQNFYKKFLDNLSENY